MKKSFFFLLILLLVISSQSYAQFNKFKENPYSNTLILSLGGGLNYSETDYPNSIFGLNGLGTAEYFFRTNSKLFLGLKFETGLSIVKGENNINSKLSNFEINVITVGPGLTLNYQLNKTLYPYIGFDVKSSWFKSEIGLDLVANFGFKFLLSQYFALNSNVGFNFVNKDNLDDMIVKGSDNDYFTIFSIGISYAVDFTITDDHDGDGIKNEFDNCPEQAEDYDGFKDQDGCPDLDNDGDGILDNLDKCPDTKEDFDGFNDEDGCPELDNDGDGILDNIDQCPNKPETFNSFEDGDGCPDVLPETHFIEELKDYDESKNIEFEDSEPEVIENKIRISIPNEFLINGDKTFNNGSSVVKQSAYSSLNEIVKQMKSNSGFRWRIEGHLDNSGTPFELKALSTARANVIMNYFVSKGISSNTFQVVGHGDKYPVVPNSTIQGQIKNRRVVIRRIR